MTSFYYYSNIDRLIDFHLINWTYTLWKYYMPPWIINIRDVWLRARSFIDIRVWHKCQRKYANEGLHILSKVVWCHNNIFFSFDYCQNSSMVHTLLIFCTWTKSGFWWRDKLWALCKIIVFTKPVLPTIFFICFEKFSSSILNQFWNKRNYKKFCQR